MPVRDILRLCVLLHISSSFHKCAECGFVIKPHDVIAVTGEVVTLNCSSSAFKRGNIAWSVGVSRNYIYARDELSPNVTSYINVTDGDDGNCSLTITASLEAANKYICRELDSGNEASAELTVMENLAKCTREIKNLSLHVSCSIVSAGNWAPTVLCMQVIEGTEHSWLQANETTKSNNNAVTSTWNFSSKKDSCYTKITCLTEFKHHGRSTQTIATYCPPCSFKKLGFPSSSRFLNIDDSELWSNPNYSGCLNQPSRYLLQGFEMALSNFSNICYTVSVVALLLTIFTYVITWKLSGSVQAVFLINLCVALIMVYSIELAGAQRPSDYKEICKVIVLLLQYSILAAFCILLAEGVKLLLCITFEFQDRGLWGTIETIGLIVAAWGLPIIIVGVSIASSKVVDDDNGLVCWLLLDRSFIWAFAAPVCCLTLVYIVISTHVLRRLCRTASLLPRSVKKRNQIRSTFWNMVFTCPVLFLGCLFDAFAIINDSVVFLHLFVLMQSLQGLIILIFHLLCNRKILTAKCCSITCFNFNPQPGLSGDDQTKSKELEWELSSVNSEPGLSGDDQTMSKEPERQLSSVSFQPGLSGDDQTMSKEPERELSSVSFQPGLSGDDQTMSKEPGLSGDDPVLSTQKPVRDLSLVSYLFDSMTGVELRSIGTQTTSVLASDNLGVNAL